MKNNRHTHEALTVPSAVKNSEVQTSYFHHSLAHFFYTFPGCTCLFFFHSFSCLCDCSSRFSVCITTSLCFYYKYRIAI